MKSASAKFSSLAHVISGKSLIVLVLVSVTKMRRSSRHVESSSPGKGSRICERKEHTRATVSSTPQVRINQETSPGSRNPSNSIRWDCTPSPSVQRHLGSWDTTQRDYTNQAWRSRVINEGVPCLRVNKGPDFLNTDPSEKNPSSMYSVTTSELNVQAISDVPKERKFKKDARLYSSGNTMQAHVTGCSNQNTDLDCEQRTYKKYYSHQVFVGLTNSGNSCCVNVLLQTLFMTPDYKVLLLKCQQKGILIKASYHIPYQLNKVFKNLNSRTQRTVSPDNFIQCLMLNHINVEIQLDAEELFRSLFLLLLDQLKETDFIKYVNDLHMVITEECNRCLKCQHEFMQIGNMLTIPLSLYNPSSRECYKSIENSLKSFFKCQRLDGDNKSHCDKCGEKTATLQSYRVYSYPQILCLQLKRFDLAPNMRKAVKSNDFMEFQDELYSESFNEGHDSQRNKWQYKLLSVIVHKGSAAFGHYYAYIRDFQEMNWYQFDDEHVLSATWEDVTKTFGSLNSSSLDQNEFHMEGTAYLLFYKRMD
ncbi:ubl carboxyl-terminal hydrolase 18-like [Carcharodon carcharias]|uniref:ubl carboxyl-terminal hydrolase 18-like n=1 Tax=Carcharodon carcharias TaxID=13397 RepID=UPI001B7DA3AE|nr:ubl carboxyl-terminal hydrolase 18-like [Carcharodon carcharias]